MNYTESSGNFKRFPIKAFLLKISTRGDHNLPGRKILLLAAAFTLGANGLAADDLDQRIALARSAAPPSVSANAAIVVDGKVVVQGSNGWTCMPNTMPGDNAPMCNDAM
jgi:hypothetical protein